MYTYNKFKKNFISQETLSLIFRTDELHSVRIAVDGFFVFTLIKVYYVYMYRSARAK